MKKTLWNLLQERSGQGGEEVAFVHYAEDGKQLISVTRGQFFHDIKCKAHICQNIVEQRIGIWGYNSYEWIVSAVGILLSGKQLILLDANLNDEDLRILTEYSDTEALMVEKQLQGEAQKIFPKMPVYDFGFGNGEIAEEEIEEKDFMCFTSGTSKSSKGVVITTEAMANIVRMAVNVLKGKKGDRYFLPLPFHHIYGFAMIFHILYAQGIICIAQGARYLQKNMNEFQPQVAFLVPAMLKYLLNKYVFPESVYAIYSGGSMCSPEYEGMVRAKGIELYNVYGLSETIGMVCSSGIEKGISWLKPFGDIQFVKTAEGELGIRLPHHMLEYYKRKEETDMVLEGDFFLTGDAVEMDEDGYFRIMGRLRDTVALENGEKIHVEDLENKISKLPGVKEAAIYVYKGNLATAVVLEKDFCREDFMRVWNEWNQRQMVSHRVHKLWIRKMPVPRTTTGKIRRFQLVQEYEKAKNHNRE